jgi:hypothetical protein
MEWADASGLRLWWGRGRQDGSFYAFLDHREVTHHTISVWTYGRVEAEFQYMRTQAPFDATEKREEFRLRLNSLPGVQIPPDGIERRPSFALSGLTAKDAMSQFLATLDWVVGEIRRS